VAASLLGTTVLGAEPVNEGVEGEGLGKSTLFSILLLLSDRGLSGRDLSELGRSRSDRGHQAGGSDRSGSNGGRGSRSRSRDGTVGGSVRDNGLGTRSRTVKSRSRDLVGSGTLVRVEENTRLRVSVELSGQGTLRVIGSRTSDVNVEALRVVLSTVLGTSAVKSDDLVTEDVATSSKCLGDSGSPGVVVLDKIGSSPSTIKASSIDLDPLESSRVSGSALSSALGNVGQNRTNVRLGPGRPLELDGTTGLDGQRAGTGSSLLVAGNVGSAKVGGGDETVVEVFSGPSSDVGDLATLLSNVVRGEVVAGLVGSVNLDASDGSVGEGDRGESASESSSNLERHDDCLKRERW
jgi:hypothetical protein